MMLRPVPKAAALLVVLVVTCLQAVVTIHGQAFTMPGLSDLPALPGLATGLVNSITSGAPSRPDDAVFPEPKMERVQVRIA